MTVIYTRKNDTFIELKDRGIHGNGHMLMLEKNNAEIAAVMMDWLERVLPRNAA